MIVSRSRAWWQQFSAAGVLVALASCSSGSTLPEPIEDNDPGSISGELVVYIATNEDGTGETQYMLRNEAGDERRLLFDVEPEVEPGAKVHVWGQASGEAFSVTKVKRAFSDPVGFIGSQSSALVNPVPRAPRAVCSVLVRISGGAVPAAITPDSIEAQFHTGATSVDAYYQENSYGKDSIIGKTYGPLDYAATSTCDTTNLTKTLRPMITDVCDQYSWVMAPKQGCQWSGLAQVGTSTKPAKDTWYNASIGCVVTVQEPGHNYGMNHSSSLNCGTAFLTDTLAGCTHSEYGDRFDPMGGGCRHMNVWQKQYEQWFGACNAIKVRSSGTFNLLPTEIACDGVQSIQLPFPAGKTRLLNRPAGGGGAAGMDTLTSYYLEYRTSLGFDKGMIPQVLVHTGTNPLSMTGQTRGAPHTWILNASAKGLTSTQPGLVAGGSFADPAGGLTVTVVSLDADKAVIQVDYAAGSDTAPTCLDNTSLQAPGPTVCTGTVITTDGGVISTGAGGGAPRDAGRDTGTIGAGGGTGGRPSDGGATGGSGGAGGGPELDGGEGSGTGGSPTGVGGGPTGVGGGVTGTGPTGTTVTTATGMPKPPPGDIDAGCACHVGSDARSNRSGLASLVALGLGGLLTSRRRRRR